MHTLPDGHGLIAIGISARIRDVAGRDTPEYSPSRSDRDFTRRQIMREKRADLLAALRPILDRAAIAGVSSGHEMLEDAVKFVQSGTGNKFPFEHDLTTRLRKILGMAPKMPDFNAEAKNIAARMDLQLTGPDNELPAVADEIEAAFRAVFPEVEVSNSIVPSAEHKARERVRDARRELFEAEAAMPLPPRGARFVSLLRQLSYDIEIATGRQVDIPRADGFSPCNPFETAAELALLLVDEPDILLIIHNPKATQTNRRFGHLDLRHLRALVQDEFRAIIAAADTDRLHDFVFSSGETDGLVAHMKWILGGHRLATPAFDKKAMERVFGSCAAGYSAMCDIEQGNYVDKVTSASLEEWSAKWNTADDEPSAGPRP